MLNSLRQRVAGWIAGTSAEQTRSYDGAAGGYRGSGMSDTANVVAAMAAARSPLARRARYLVANNALAFSGVEAWVNGLIGYGIKHESRHENEEVRANLNASFSRFVDEVDADGLLDFFGIQTLMTRQMVTEGEAFAVMINTPDGLRLRVIDNEQCDPNLTRTLEGGTRIIQGIEIDAFGNRLAYHILPDNPGLPYGAVSLTPQRIPAANVIHMFRQVVPGQVRGVSWLAPVMLRLTGLDLWADAQLTRQQMAAMLTVFVKGGTGDAPFDTSLSSKGISPGGIRYLDEGQEPMFLTPASIGDEVIKFALIQERHVAVGMSLPLAVLNGDLSAANYGSIRAGLVEWRRRLEGLQHNVIAFQLLRRVWERWVLIEILSGRITGTTVEEALPVNWIPPRFDWVDPKKDVEAEILAVDNLLMSRTEAVAARGQNIEELDAAIAADQARAKRLGLTVKPANQNQPPVKDDAA